MGNVCCSDQDEKKSKPVIRQRSLIDPETKKQYEKSLQDILNQALEKFEQNYKIKQLKLQGLIGKGGQASVFLVDVICQQAEKPVVKKFAMKRVSKKHISKKKFIESLMLQKEILTSRPSCFITQVEFACQDQAYFYFFMKLAIGGDCFPYVQDESSLWQCADSEITKFRQKATQFKKLGEEAIIFILAGVILGLESLHARNVIYRDLKPQNVFIFEDGYPKLADFGVAAKLNDQEDVHFEMMGTILYFAPQIMVRSGYDRSVDLWALGIFAYELAFKQPPFNVKQIKSPCYEQTIYQRYQANKWPSQSVSNEMKDFINRLLVSNPPYRLGYNSFSQLKKHKLFKSLNWRQYQTRQLRSPLIELISTYPVHIQASVGLNEIIDQQDHGYVPFTFVEKKIKNERETVEIVPISFIIDKSMNLKVKGQSLQGKIHKKVRFQ